MLIVEQNTTYVNWNLGDEVRPLRYYGDVVISMDPSKTNFALVIGTPEKTILNILEFSGNNRGRGPVIDTTLFCEQLRQFLTQYLQYTNLYAVGVEKTVLPRGKKANYHSVTVLNEIRSTILSFFFEQFQVTPVEVNNWSWKAGVLPEGYRSMSEKGSKRFFVEHMSDTPYASYYEADVTDAICIFWYLCETTLKSYSMFCNKIEQSFTGFKYTFVPCDSDVTTNLREVIYNDRFSLADNITYYSNRILSPFCFEIPSSEIPFEDVYGRSMLFKLSNLKDVKVKVVAKRL